MGTTESDDLAGGYRPQSVTEAVIADLARLPPDLQTCAEALAARALAGEIDAGEAVATCTRELRATMDGLRARAAALTAPAKPQVSGLEAGEDDGAEDGDAVVPVKGSPVADLAARIADRRRSSSV